MDVAAPIDPFADPRSRMVDSQVRPNKVYDPRILAAMRSIPRERFLPPAMAALAYAPLAVVSGAGGSSRRSISKARLSSAIPRGSDRERPVSCSSRRIRCRTVLG